MGELTKAMLNFLAAVERGEVRLVKGYTARRGGYYRFIGGEARAKEAANAGLVKMPHTPDLGRPALATLTDAGRSALEASK